MKSLIMILSRLNVYGGLFTIVYSFTLLFSGEFLGAFIGAMLGLYAIDRGFILMERLNDL